MSLHKEINFEIEICEHLAAHGWLYAEGDAAELRPCARAVPGRCAGLGAGDPAARRGRRSPRTTARRPARRCSTACASSSTSAARSMCCATASRCSGLQQPLKLAEFKPALAMNPDILARYAANRLRVVRQVRYSLHNENCIDLVLFLNGLPVATVELKTDFTQSVGDAIDQYRFDRHPAAQGPGRRAAAVLPQRRAGALRGQQQRSAHDDASWTARPRDFLPFNQGDDGAQGNPVNPQAATAPPTCGSRSGQRDSWLEILGRYLVAQRDDKKQIEQIIFPRYHQLDATRKLQAAVLDGGAGRQVPRSSTRQARARPTRSPGRRTSWPSCTTRSTRRCSTPCWWSPTAT